MGNSLGALPFPNIFPQVRTVKSGIESRLAHSPGTLYLSWISHLWQTLLLALELLSPPNHFHLLGSTLEP